ncbi:hypothetical protein CVT24_004947 [Panaeolus cyanescens]|uniref:Uncharacterized protein n=1 Tax=Panaeolus cyanescens TaxID=181874 RepID=A0A409VEF8_9AGAR|nr:hypothetical protein CVT24_004947 [Panaeolus cyanescens]
MSSSELSNALNPYASQSRQRQLSNINYSSQQHSYNQQPQQPLQHRLQHDQYPVYDHAHQFESYQNLTNHVNLQQSPVANPDITVQHTLNQQIPFSQPQPALQQSSIPIQQVHQTHFSPPPHNIGLWQDAPPYIRHYEDLQRRMKEKEEELEAFKREQSTQMQEIKELLKKNLEKLEEKDADYNTYKQQQLEKDKKREEEMQNLALNISKIAKKVEGMESTNSSTIAELRTMVNANRPRQSLSQSPSHAAFGSQPPATYHNTLQPAPNITSHWNSASTPHFHPPPSPAPFNSVHISHLSPSASSLNAGSPANAPSPYPASTAYSPSPFPFAPVNHANGYASAASPSGPHSPLAVAGFDPSPPSKKQLGKRKREVYSDDEEDSDQDDKPHRLNNHDKRIITINKAMKVHIYQMMGIVEKQDLPDPPDEEDLTPSSDSKPLQFFWDKTTTQKAHNGRMKLRVIRDIQENKDLYPHVPKRQFSKSCVDAAFEAVYTTLQGKYKTQRDPKEAQKMRVSTAAKCKASRHKSRRKDKLERRAAARTRLHDFDHKIYDNAMDGHLMSSDESVAEIDPNTQEKVKYFLTHPPAWRSKALTKYYEKLDAADAEHQKTLPKKGAGRLPRKPGPPKDSPDLLPPNGVSSWMVSKTWINKQRATREGFDAQLSGRVGDLLDDIPDNAGLAELVGDSASDDGGDNGGPSGQGVTEQVDANVTGSQAQSQMDQSHPQPQAQLWAENAAHPQMSIEHLKEYPVWPLQDNGLNFGFYTQAAGGYM